MSDTFTPTIYVRQGCPFCLKLRLFLLETGQLAAVDLREGQDDEEHRRLADHLTARLGKASFPSAEVAPGEFEATCEPGGTYLIGSPETVAAGAITASAVLGGVTLISFQLGISLLPHDTTARVSIGVES